MANTAALLGTLLTKNADVNYYTQQQIYWSNKQEANAAKLKKQTSYEEKWEKAYDDAMSGDKNCTVGNTTYVKKGDTCSESTAEAYAKAKVKEYNEELSLELAELDVEYDSMKAMYETLLESLRADQDGLKSAVSQAAKDTCMLNQ